MIATRFPTLGHTIALARRHSVLSLVAFAAVLAAGSWVRSYLASPGRVVRMASGALSNRDADGLVALASPVELRQLRITPSAVMACLKEGVWREVPDAGVSIKRMRQHYGDVLIFDVDFISDAIPGRKRNSEIWVYQDPRGKWRLALSHLLYCLQQATGEPREWDATARRAGLLGCTLPGGSTRWAADGSHSNTINLTGNTP